MSLVDTTLLTFKAICIVEFFSQVQGPEVGLSDVGFTPFNSQGEAQGCEFPANCETLHHGKVVPQPLLPVTVWGLISFIQV